MSKHSFSILSCAICAWIICLSCNRNGEIEKNIQAMLNTQVILSLDSMSCYVGCNQIKHQESANDYKVIVYTDSAECASCSLQSLYDYKEQINKFCDVYKNKIGFCFIFSPKQGDIKKVKQKVLRSNFDLPIFIDSTNIFGRQNPSIPCNKMYHTFIIDKNKNIVLVGNPIVNEKIAKLMERIVLPE